MKNSNTAKKLLASALAVALMVGITAACANRLDDKNDPTVNPAGNGGDTGSATEADVDKVPEPVDLSVLTEAELDKLSADLIEKLKEVEKNGSVKVNITVVDPLSYVKFDDETLANIEKSNEGTKLEVELENKVQELLAERDELTFNSDDASEKRKLEIQEELDELNEKRNEIREEYSSYQLLTNAFTIGKKYVKPVMDEYMKRHNMENFGASENYWLVCMFLHVDVNPVQVIEMAKDSETTKIGLYIPTKSEWVDYSLDSNPPSTHDTHGI